ncbi:hypothetical protein JVU11DRAFT_8196 [Chiua virens]|nr:hypothetical protein JVU11DRAFT_8196 [Chiua virens]
MSLTRNRNKCCLSLDGSSCNTSNSTLHLSRWSEVVPPRTALTFAALWDPEDGMVTFSGAALLESESLSGNAFDEDGQFISVDTDGSSTIGENTATLATFQDAFKAFLHRTPWNSKEHLHTRAGQGTSCYLQSRASSTFDGLDVYSHDIQLKRTRSLQLSCFDLLDTEPSFRASSGFGKLWLRSDLIPDSNRPESDSDSSSKSRPPYLKSRFSTTTSTSNYIDVATGALQSQRTSETSPAREWTQQEDGYVSPANSWPSLPHRRRLLRKRRPPDGAASPSTMSPTPSTPRKLTTKMSMSMSLSSSPSTPSSSATTSTRATLEEVRRGRFPRPIGGPITSVPTPPNSPTKSPRLKLRFSLLPRRKSRPTSSESEGWVCIEVTPTIRQHYIEDLDELEA